MQTRLTMQQSTRLDPIGSLTKLDRKSPLCFSRDTLAWWRASAAERTSHRRGNRSDAVQGEQEARFAYPRPRGEHDRTGQRATRGEEDVWGVAG